MVLSIRQAAEPEVLTTAITTSLRFEKPLTISDVSDVMKHPANGLIPQNASKREGYGKNLDNNRSEAQKPQEPVIWAGSWGDADPVPMQDDDEILSRKSSLVRRMTWFSLPVTV